MVFLLLLRIVCSFASSIICNRVPGLTPAQRQLCSEAPDAFIALGDGHMLGAEECQHQFKGKEQSTQFVILCLLHSAFFLPLIIIIFTNLLAIITLQFFYFASNAEHIKIHKHSSFQERMNERTNETREKKLHLYLLLLNELQVIDGIVHKSGKKMFSHTSSSLVSEFLCLACQFYLYMLVWPSPLPPAQQVTTCCCCPNVARRAQAIMAVVMSTTHT